MVKSELQNRPCILLLLLLISVPAIGQFSPVCSDSDNPKIQTVTLYVLTVSLILYRTVINDLLFTSFVCYVYVQYVPCYLSLIIYICMLCCFCNWPSGCWFRTSINMNWIELNWIIQCVYEWMVQFQKLTINLFLTLHRHNVHRQQRQLSSFSCATSSSLLMHGLEKTHHAWCVFSKPCTALHAAL